MGLRVLTFLLVVCVTKADNDLNCDFEIDLCSWIQSKNDNQDWTYHSGGTSTLGTGPSADHTTGIGHYIYLETSVGRPDDTAELYSPFLEPRTTGTLRFWHHMYGSDINSLSVFFEYLNGVRSLEWTKRGNQGDQWLQGRVMIPAKSQPFRIVIQATKGKSYHGDIGLDDILVDGQFTVVKVTPSINPVQVSIATPTRSGTPVIGQTVKVSNLSIITCRECKDVGNPKLCSDTIICGEDEICMTREYVTHRGQHSFCMGCESMHACDLLMSAKDVFGKKSSVPDDLPSSLPALCHECCSTEECNEYLCQNSIHNNLTLPQHAFGHHGHEFLTCRECKDVVDPNTCSDTIICGQGEVCVTSEFTNHLGRHGFRLGCQSKNTCNLLKYAMNAFGKRADSLHPPALCHECCEADECNTDLCKTAVPVATAKTGCPDYYGGFNNSCYMFGPGISTWTQAKSFCKSKGAGLLVVNTIEEFHYWNKTLVLLNAPSVSDFWLDGVYSHPLSVWQWLDGSLTQYTSWTGSSTPSSSSNNYAYCATLDVANNRVGMNNAQCTITKGIICEIDNH